VKHAAQQEARRRLNEISLLYWHKKLDEVAGLLERLDRRNPLVSKRTLRLMIGGAHPDRGGTDAAAAEVNGNRKAIEIALCSKEAERPKMPSHTDVPRTWTEMMAAREKVKAENSERAKRAAATHAARKSPQKAG